MKNRKADITSKAVTLVENHSFLATLLAALCLLFAVNYFLTGPGSDGGSGLGGTGKFGGESGFGGTGKSPGSEFKLGANDGNEQEDQYTDYLTPEYSPLDDLHDELGIARNDAVASDSSYYINVSKMIEPVSETPKPAFDVTALRLSPEQLPAPVINTADQFTISDLVANVELVLPTTDTAGMDTFMTTLLDNQRDGILADSLVASLDILNSLMVAENEASLQLASADVGSDIVNSAAIRNRVAVPVRPERPDRFTMPTRVAPIQRVDVPAPPPVRPMRTLSSLLNK